MENVLNNWYNGINLPNYSKKLKSLFMETSYINEFII